MKILVQNYSSETSTEPFYLSQAFKDVEIESEVWNTEQISAFDVVDKFQPNVIIIDYKFLGNDLLKRIDGTDIKITLNTSDANQEVLNKIKSDFPHFLTFDSKTLPPCADIFLEQRESKINYEIDTLYLLSHGSQMFLAESISENVPSFHTHSFNLKLKTDLHLNSVELAQIFKNYKNIEVGVGCGQSMYDAAYYSKKEKVRILGQNDSFLTKSVVLSEHLPYNRIAKLFEWLGETELKNRAEEYARNYSNT